MAAGEAFSPAAMTTDAMAGPIQNLKLSSGSI
jgi:hypothetical protein